MKIREAVAVAGAITALDGYTKIVRDGGQEKMVHAPYEFSANVRFSLAKNANAVTQVSRAFSTARNALVRQFSNGGDEVPSAAMPAFDAAVTELLDRDEDIEISLLSEKDLNLEKNPIPPSIIAALMPLLE